MSDVWSAVSRQDRDANLNQKAGFGDYLRALDDLSEGAAMGLDNSFDVGSTSMSVTSNNTSKAVATPPASSTMSAGVHQHQQSSKSSSPNIASNFCPNGSHVSKCADELADVLPGVLALSGDGAVPKGCDPEVFREGVTLLNGLGESEGAVAICNIMQLLIKRVAEGHQATRGAADASYRLATEREAMERIKRDAESIAEERNRLREDLQEARQIIRSSKEKSKLERSEHENAIKDLQRELGATKRKAQAFTKKEEQFKVEIRRRDQQYDKLQATIQKMREQESSQPTISRSSTFGGASKTESRLASASTSALLRKREAEISDLIAENEDLRAGLQEMQADLTQALTEREELLEELALLRAELDGELQPQDDGEHDLSEESSFDERPVLQGPGGAARVFKQPVAKPSPKKESPRRQWDLDLSSDALESPAKIFAVHNIKGNENATNDSH